MEPLVQVPAADHGHGLGTVKAPIKSKKSSSFDVTAHNAAPPAHRELSHAGGKQSNIQLRKPGKRLYFRVHPDATYSAFDVPVIDDSKEGDLGLLFVSPALIDELPDDVAEMVSYAHMVTCVTQHNRLFIWYFSAFESDWSKSAMRVVSQAKTSWTKMVADKSISGYLVYPAPAVLQAKQPDFGTLTPKEIFAQATEGRMIDSLDDPMIQKLQGLD